MEDVVPSTALRPGETTPEKAIARLDAMVERALAAPTEADATLAVSVFGVPFAPADLPDSALAGTPYGVALGIAHRRRTGFDPARARAALPSLTRADSGDVLVPPLGPESVSSVVPK